MGTPCNCGFLPATDSKQRSMLWATLAAMITDIFLSYAREDASKAIELVRILEKDGWSVWWDHDVTAGQDFELEIDMALAEARVVVVLWSAFSVTSNWVRNEAREAKELNKLIGLCL